MLTMKSLPVHQLQMLGKFLRFCSGTSGMFAFVHAVSISKSLFQWLEDIIFNGIDKDDDSFLLRYLHHNNLSINLPLSLIKRATVQSLLGEKGHT